MTEFLKSLVMSLSGVIIFGIICERILPRGVYKKYIQLTIGFVLILTLISPFAGEKFEIEIEIPPEKSAQEMAESMDERERSEILRLYKSKLCEKMTEDMKETAGVDFEIKCQVCSAGEGFGQIENVWITVDGEGGAAINKSAVDVLRNKYGIDEDAISVKYVAGSTKAQKEGL